MLPEVLALKLKCLLAMFLITILLFGCAVSPAEAPDVSAGVDACGLRGWLVQCTKPSGVPRGPSHLQFP